MLKKCRKQEHLTNAKKKYDWDQFWGVSYERVNKTTEKKAFHFDKRKMIAFSNEEAPKDASMQCSKIRLPLSSECYILSKQCITLPQHLGF